MATGFLRRFLAAFLFKLVPAFVVGAVALVWIRDTLTARGILVPPLLFLLILTALYMAIVHLTVGGLLKELTRMKGKAPARSDSSPPASHSKGVGAGQDGGVDQGRHGTRRVSIWKVQAILGAGVAFFLGFAGFSVYLSVTVGLAWEVSAAFLGFALFEAGLLLTRGPLELNEAGITMRTPLGVYRMGWDEAITIDIRISDLWIIGKDRHLAAVAPTFWTGPDKAEAVRILDEKAKGVRRRKPLFILPWSSNCRLA